MIDFITAQETLKPYFALIISIYATNLLVLTLALGYYVKTRVLRLQHKQLHLLMSFLIFWMIVTLITVAGMFGVAMFTQN